MHDITLSQRQAGQKSTGLRMQLSVLRESLQGCFLPTLKGYGHGEGFQWMEKGKWCIWEARKDAGNCRLVSLTSIHEKTVILEAMTRHEEQWVWKGQIITYQPDCLLWDNCVCEQGESNAHQQRCYAALTIREATSNQLLTAFLPPTTNFKLSAPASFPPTSQSSHLTDSSAVWL